MLDKKFRTITFFYRHKLILVFDKVEEGDEVGECLIGELFELPGTPPVRAGSFALRPFAQDPPQAFWCETADVAVRREVTEVLGLSCHGVLCVWGWSP